MATRVIMPALEMAQETGKILSWLKKEGDSIAKGEMLLEIETDKVVFEMEAPGDGLLSGIKTREGDVVPVGQTIAWILAPGEKIPEELATASAERAMLEQARQVNTSAATPSQPAAPSQPATQAFGDRQRMSPRARRIAQEKGVDVTQLRGTGPGGVISAEDVLAAAESKTVSGAAAAADTGGPATTSGLSAIARLMAERTTQSWTQTPHFFLVRDVNAGALIEARQRLGPAIERDRGVKLTHTDFLVALTARALAKHPKQNAKWTGEGIQLNPSVNISMAIAVTDGVVGAVIPNADTTALADIALRRRDLTERARSGKLRTADIAGGTFTISNLGMLNVDAFTAIITPPQAAVLAVGRIADRVIAVNGQPGVRPMMTITLSSDHRVVDGAQAAAFLNDLVAALEEPTKWLS
jgi:pyruvate dehydrogenase E2 component (dihydrolipoamide acetyltransferase)